MFLEQSIKRSNNIHGGLIEVMPGLIMLVGGLIIRFVIVLLNGRY